MARLPRRRLGGEGVAGLGMDRLAPRECLPAAKRGIDITGFELHPGGLAAGFLGPDQGGATAEETVEDEAASFRAVEDRIGDQRDRLNGRMQGQLLEPAGPQRVYARIVPDIGAVAA